MDLVFVFIGIQISYAVGISEFIAEVPPECDGLTYCYKVYNYPEEYMNNIIDKIYPDKKEIIESNLKLLNVTDTNEKGDINLCTYKIEMTMPQAIRENVKSKWRFALNTPTQPVQVFWSEICNQKAVKQPCEAQRKGLLHPYSVYASKCVQKYAHRNLTGVDGKGKTMTITVQSFPTCCSCVFYRID